MRRLRERFPSPGAANERIYHLVFISATLTVGDFRTTSDPPQRPLVIGCNEGISPASPTVEQAEN